MEIRFHPEAEREFADAIRWYDHQREGLGDEFSRCIDQSLERVLKNPQMYPTAYKGYRRIVMRRFPFSIFYDLTNLS